MDEELRMAHFNEAALERAAQYALSAGCEVANRLGFGIDGTVFGTDRQSALKVFDRPSAFHVEHAVYLRLLEHRVQAIQGLTVPQLVGADRQLCILELSIVQPPYLLDFARAQLDRPLDFPLHVMEQWYVDKAEQFGDDWPRVQSVMRELERRYGIYLLDANPGNFNFDSD